MLIIYLLLWFVLLVLVILISVFLHEIAHGISAYLNGISVSTGFNKVGDIYKKPEDGDFRKEHKNQKNYADFGVLVTLLLAILFTYLLYNIDNKYLLWIIGAVAFSNSLLRLIPMVHIYFKLIFKGELVMEDEIGAGIILYKRTKIKVLKYLPSLISLFISYVCFRYVRIALYIKLTVLFSSQWYFIVVSLLAFLLSFKLLNKLDNIIRINWG